MSRDNLLVNHFWELKALDNYFFSSGDASKILLDSYTKELSLKERLVMEFTHCKNRDELMVYLSLWLHEPLLNDENEVLLKSMLIEADLR